MKSSTVLIFFGLAVLFLICLEPTAANGPKGGIAGMIPKECIKKLMGNKECMKNAKKMVPDLMKFKNKKPTKKEFDELAGKLSENGCKDFVECVKPHADKFCAQ